MKTIDVKAAKAEGYSDAEIAEFLAEQKGLDLKAARAEGYQDSEIVRQLSAGPMLPPTVVKDPVSGGYAMPSLQNDQGVMGSIVSGAGKTVDSLIAGALQMFGGDSKELKDTQAAKRAAYQGIESAHPYAAGFGESLPIAVATAPLLGPGAAALGGGAGGLLASGAALGAAGEGLKYGTLSERAKGAAIGGASGLAGGLLGIGASRALAPAVKATVRPYPMAKPGAMDDAIAAAKRIGYKPTAGQITGSPMLQAYENKLASQPGFSGQMLELAQGNQRAINQQAAKAIGQSGDEVTEAMFASADDAISSEFKRLGSLAKPNVQSQELFGAIDSIDKANRAAGSFASKKVDKLVNNALKLWEKGDLSGEAYNSVRKQLGQRAGKAFKAGEHELGNAHLKLQGLLDEAADASLPTADKGLFSTVRRQSGDLQALMGGQVVDGGNVSAARAASSLRRFNPKSFKKGSSKSELMDIARVGESFRSFGNPNSAAAQGFGDGLSGLISSANNRVKGGIYMSPLMQGYLTSNIVPDSVRRSVMIGGVPAGLLLGGAVSSGAK